MQSLKRNYLVSYLKMLNYEPVQKRLIPQDAAMLSVVGVAERLMSVLDNAKTFDYRRGPK